MNFSTKEEIVFNVSIILFVSIFVLAIVFSYFHRRKDNVLDTEDKHSTFQSKDIQDHNVHFSHKGNKYFEKQVNTQPKDTYIPNLNSQIVFYPVIYFLFDDMKRSYSQIRKRIFRKNKNKNLSKSVKNILKKVSSRDLLTKAEIKEIDRLFYEIAITGIVNNSTNYEKFKKYLLNIGYPDPDYYILHEYIEIYDIDHLILILEGLSSELEISFNLFDYSSRNASNQKPKIRIGANIVSPEINLLVLFPIYKCLISENSAKNERYDQYNYSKDMNDANYPQGMNDNNYLQDINDNTYSKYYQYNYSQGVNDTNYPQDINVNSHPKYYPYNYPQDMNDNSYPKYYQYNYSYHRYYRYNNTYIQDYQYYQNDNSYPQYDNIYSQYQHCNYHNPYTNQNNLYGNYYFYKDKVNLFLYSPK